jgi:predicted DNA-binding ribbon-helix-helix protein
MGRHKTVLRQRTLEIGQPPRKQRIKIEISFWLELEDIAKEKRISLCELVTQIDRMSEAGSLDSRLRMYVLYYKSKSKK